MKRVGAALQTFEGTADAVVLVTVDWIGRALIILVVLTLQRRLL